jgi:hypothetical protein
VARLLLLAVAGATVAQMRIAHRAWRGAARFEPQIERELVIA